MKRVVLVVTFALLAAAGPIPSNADEGMWQTHQLPELGGELPEQIVLRRGEWGKLRKRDSSDLMEGRSEAVAEDYRGMVHAYFKTVAKKTKKE